MNFRTTLFLAAVLAMLGIAYLWRPQPVPADSTPVETPRYGGPTVARDLIEQKLGDVVKVVCQKKGEEHEWVFEQDSDEEAIGQAKWMMTSPVEMNVTSYSVRGIGDQLGRLTYEVSYKPGEPGAVSAANAGLDPPEAVISLTDADGKTASVEIGKPASANGTYVRLAGADEICVSDRSLGTLLKSSVLEYRDRQVWSFKPADVTRLEIVDRQTSDAPVTYAFAKDGVRWMMELPVTAKATSKVDDAVNAMSRLRVAQWDDDQRERLAAYGFEPAVLTIRATVEEEIPIDGDGDGDDEGEEGDDDASDGDEDQTKTKVTVYELHLSDRSPIGEETKTYLRVADEAMVATVMKSTADKFKPVMAEWREMRITTANVTGATSIQLATADGETSLVKRDGRWWFADDDGPAEDPAVKELLTAIRDLTAVAFVDGEVTDAAKFGLDKPQADVQLTIPGVEGTERIVVGAYTDPNTKRLVYMRRNQLASVAKVRTNDIAKLIREARAYRDRTVFNIPANRIERLSLTTENQFADGKLDLVLERSADGWAMTSPVSAAVRTDQVDKLSEALGSLRAKSIVATSGQASAFGLHAPAARIVLTHKPPVEYRFEPPKAKETESEGKDSDASGAEGDVETGDAEAPERLVPVEVQPESELLELLIAEHDGKIFAKRADGETVFEVSADLLRMLRDEYRSSEVLAFDESNVKRFSVRSGEQVYVFERADDRWVYLAEPDLPLDSDKVENLLLQIKDLKTERYVTYASGSADAFGLDAPQHQVTITMKDGLTRNLRISGRVCDRDPKKGHFSSIDDRAGVFLLTTDAAARFHVSLDVLEARP